MTMPQQKPGRSHQDYKTPPEFITAVKLRLQIPGFDIDLAASDNDIATRYYSVEDDSLDWTTPWKVGDGWNWLNPPFGKIRPWVDKAWSSSISYGAKTAVLVPASVGSNWWREYVHMKAYVLFLNGRLTFVGETDPYPKDCALLLYAPYLDGGYSVWSWDGY